MIITIGGSIGSGKTTLAAEISRRFDMAHVSVGQVMRQMAKERGMDILEFSKYAEANPSVDKEIDRKQKSMCSNGNSVVDGRLSAYMLDANLRLWLDAPLEVRAQRVSKRDKTTETRAKKDIIKREESEKKRYKDIYKIDLDDRAIYDLIINTKRFTVEEIVSIVSAIVKSI
jgi:cytidylate kinase